MNEKHAVEIRYAYLCREAALAAESIGIGLTCFRRHSMQDNGKFATGMFSIGVGMERLLKLNIILEHDCNKGGLPSNQELRKAGHNVSDLFSRTQKINSEMDLGVSDDGVNEIISRTILSHISEFSIQARYYNLDLVSGSSAQHRKGDPMQRWNAEVAIPILQRHHKISKRERQALSYAYFVEDNSLASTYFFDYSGEPVCNFAAATRQILKDECVQKFSVLYIHTLVNFCCKILQKLQLRLPYPCFLDEFFLLFLDVPRDTILRKKRWFNL